MKKKFDLKKYDKECASLYDILISNIKISIYQQSMIKKRLIRKVNRAIKLSCAIANKPLKLSLKESYFKRLCSKLKQDYEFFFVNDPSLKEKKEILFSSLPFEALIIYRFSHDIDNLEVPYLGMSLSKIAHSKTGIDINPKSYIGCPIFIDHGTGIVIGESTCIGNNCKLYHGVTLGATSLERGRKLVKSKRHPTLLDNVVVYANTAILGGNTIIGNNTIIGCNLLIKESVANNNIVSIKQNLTYKLKVK